MSDDDAGTFTPDGWRRLRRAVGPATPHAVGRDDLSQYAAVLHRRGPEAARARAPAVAAHLASGCPSCQVLLAELLALLERDLD
jgi:hypothetical protein